MHLDYGRPEAISSYPHKTQKGRKKKLDKGRRGGPPGKGGFLCPHGFLLWRNIEEVEFATLIWVDWFNNRRLLEPIGDMPPALRQLTEEYFTP